MPDENQMVVLGATGHSDYGSAGSVRLHNRGPADANTYQGASGNAPKGGV